MGSSLLSYSLIRQCITSLFEFLPNFAGKKNLHEIKRNRSIGSGDLHSEILDARPPPRSKFFQFHAVFQKFLRNLLLAPPSPQGWCPYLQEILDLPLIGEYRMQFFPENCMKMKEFRPRGRASLPPPWILQWYGDTEDNVQLGFSQFENKRQSCFSILYLKLG